MDVLAHCVVLTAVSHDNRLYSKARTALTNLEEWQFSPIRGFVFVIIFTRSYFSCCVFAFLATLYTVLKWRSFSFFPPQQNKPNKRERGGRVMREVRERPHWERSLEVKVIGRMFLTMWGMSSRISSYSCDQLQENKKDIKRCWMERHDKQSHGWCIHT